MTANELADELEKDIHWIQDELARKWVVDMLRQQQAEIEALKKQLYPTPKEFLGVTPDGVLMFKEEERNDAGFYMSDAEHYKLKCASQQAEIEALKKEMWMTEVNVQQQTLAYIIKLLTVQHDTLACTSYPMSKENREAIKK